MSEIYKKTVAIFVLATGLTQTKELIKNKPFYRSGRFQYSKTERLQDKSAMSGIAFSGRLAFANPGQPPAYCRYDRNQLNTFLQQAQRQPLIIPMGHATVLIAFKNRVILVDPIFWSQELFTSSERSIPVTPSPELLPKITDIVISHNHPDHLDTQTVRYVYSKNPDIRAHIPLKMGSFMKECGIKHITEYNWWDELELDTNCHMTMVPSRHWSTRNWFDRNKVLWGSWVIALRDKEKAWHIYCAGDTAYGDHFKTIHHFFPTLDCALVPIGPYCPPSMMIRDHVDPWQAVQVYIDLGRPIFIPIHWGVFHQGLEKLKDPLERFMQAMQDQCEDQNKIVGTTIGDPIFLA